MVRKWGGGVFFWLWSSNQINWFYLPVCIVIAVSWSVETEGNGEMFSESLTLILTLNHTRLLYEMVKQKDPKALAPSYLTFPEYAKKHGPD